MSQHYFSQEPAGSAERRRRTVTLGGREVTIETAGGVFSPEHVDTGTRVLLNSVDDPAAGDLLDLGCGWGPIALDAGLRAQASGTDARVWALDVNSRALDLTRANARALGLDAVRTVTAEEVPAAVEFTRIWSNPPIRVGKQVLHDMLRTWLPRLAPGGSAHLVVAKKLGADSLLTWLSSPDGPVPGPDFTAQREETSKGFRVLRVTRAEESLSLSPP